MGLLSKATKLTAIILAAGIMFSSATYYRASAATQSKDSTAEITTIPGDLEFTSVPSFNFLVNANKLYYTDMIPVEPKGETYGRYYQADGTIDGNFVIEDARTTGKGWTLRVSLGEFVNITDAKQKLRGAEMKIGAPTPVVSPDHATEFQGYPVTMVAGSNVFYTIAVSHSNKPQISLWEGHITSASITIPSAYELRNSNSTYKADMFWSIEDTP